MRRRHSSIDTPRVRMMKFIGGLIEILSPLISPPVSLLSIVSHVGDQWSTMRFSWNRTRICGLRIIARDVDVIIVSSSYGRGIPATKLWFYDGIKDRFTSFENN